MTTIPISQIVDIVPGVIGGGGVASKLTGLVLTQDESIAPGQGKQFSDDTTVETWFGPQANETLLAQGYFPGIVNGGQMPSDLLYVRYVKDDAPAGVYGAPFTGSLADLQQLSGVLVVGTTKVYQSGMISLASAMSFTNAAALMNQAFTGADFTISYDKLRQRFVLLTNTGGADVQCTDVSGTLAAPIGLAQSAGAFVQGTGVNADTQTSAMARVTNMSRNWGSFTHAWAATIPERLGFAAWTSRQKYQFAYLGWDLDAGSTVPDNAQSFGNQVQTTPYQGTWPLYGDVQFAGACMGYIASVNFSIPNGRTTAAFRRFNAALTPSCSTLDDAKALLSNGYTYLGAYANAANAYTITYDGKISGVFKWVDTYIDQIYLNRELQRALFESLLDSNSLPYNEDGYTVEYRAGADVAEAAVISGIIRQGVKLSQVQAQKVDSDAGRSISMLLQTRGWYLLIEDSTNPAQTRAQRTSPRAAFWYCDGGSIQQLMVNSTTIL